MIFLPGRIRTCLFEEVYCFMMVPLTRGPKKGKQVRCELCQKTFVAPYLAAHLKMHPSVRHTYVQEEVCHPAPQKFVATFYPVVNKWRCPVPICPKYIQQLVVALWLPAPAGYNQDQGRFSPTM